MRGARATNGLAYTVRHLIGTQAHESDTLPGNEHGQGVGSHGQGVGSHGQGVGSHGQGVEGAWVVSLGASP